MRKYVGVIVALAGLVILGLSAVEGNFGTILLGILALITGGIVYLGISRYGEQLEQFRESNIDYTTRPVFAYGLIQIFGFCTLFAFWMFLAVSTEIVPTPIADSVTSAPTLVVVTGVILGIVIGAGYPAFIQRQSIVPRLNVARIAFGLDYTLVISLYALLVVGPEPAVAVFYAIALLVSRLASLVTIFGTGTHQTANA